MAKKKSSTGRRKPKEDTAELLTHLIVRKLLPALEAEKNEKQALRKALVTLILATQDYAKPAGRELMEYLLTAFRPVAGLFKEMTYAISEEAWVARARDGDKIILAIAKSFVDWALGREGDEET